MKIKSLLVSTYIIIIVGIILAALLIIGIVTNQQNLNAAQEIRYRSYLRADELRQSSDDLTRLARTYVISEDEKYEKMYLDILDIRNGKKPRPEEYQRIYWDLVLEYGTKPRPDEETKALQDIMKELGFTEKEFELLTEAQNNSDALVGTEVTAMGAIKGTLDDNGKNLIKPGESYKDLAVRIMHDGAYHVEKKKIMEPIDIFFQSLDTRTLTTVNLYKKRINLLLVTSLILIFALIAIIISISIYVTIRIQNQLGEDPTVIKDITEQVAEGDLDITLDAENAKGVYRSVVKMVGSLKDKVSIIQKIALGDLNINLERVSHRDKLGLTLQTMIQSLNELIYQVNTGANQVSNGANQLASASQSLSQGATEQAGTLEEVSASITEISSQAKQNAQNSIEANEIAREAVSYAVEGNQQMQTLVEAMENINNSAKQITTIVKAIDDIAFQINLLALNANVEAARAGKYGKGFAVVAEEVRNLAGRSAESVKETTKMVDEATKNITNGNELVDKTAKQLEEIVERANQVVSLVDQITVASKEQATGLEQINLGLNQIDRVTQSNTASSEETASTSVELANQALQLQDLVLKFKLKTSEPVNTDETIEETDNHQQFYLE